MKKLLIAVCLITSTTTCFSQINKGQWLVGGSTSLNFYKYGAADDEKVTLISFSPNAGYFFANKFAGGARITVNSAKASGQEDAETSFLFAPFVRYYFLPVAQKVNVFADAGYGFGSTKSGGESAGMNAFSFAAGPAIFLSPYTALEFTLQFNSSGGDAYGTDRLYNYGFNVGFQVHLGK